MKWSKRAVPMWLVVVLAITLVGVSVAWAATSAITTLNLSTAGGQKVTVTNDLTLTSAGLTVIPSGGEGSEALTGTFAASPPTLRGNTVTSGDYVFKCVLNEITGTTPGSHAFTVTLYEDGTIVGSALTATSAVTPNSSNSVDCYWDLGTTLSTHTLYVTITE
jgi:hypothetical protein